jgi:hypothetical protein
MQVPATIRFAFSGRLLASSVRSAWAAKIILYDHRNFESRSLTLHENVADLDDYDFDNEVSAVKVISGTWELFRDDNYELNHGPSKVLGPGEYPNLSHVDFKRNKLSLLRMNSDDNGASNGNGLALADCRIPYEGQVGDGTCT